MKESDKVRFEYAFDENGGPQKKVTGRKETIGHSFRHFFPDSLGVELISTIGNFLRCLSEEQRNGAKRVVKNARQNSGVKEQLSSMISAITSELYFGKD